MRLWNDDGLSSFLRLDFWLHLRRDKILHLLFEDESDLLVDLKEAVLSGNSKDFLFLTQLFLRFLLLVVPLENALFDLFLQLILEIKVSESFLSILVACVQLTELVIFCVKDVLLVLQAIDLIQALKRWVII